MHPSDCVFVEYADDTIFVVLEFLRASGFGESNRPKAMHLPKGTHVRKLETYQFSVKHTKVGGTKSHKPRKAIDEVLAFQPNSTTHDNDDDCANW